MPRDPVLNKTTFDRRIWTSGFSLESTEVALTESHCLWLTHLCTRHPTVRDPPAVSSIGHCGLFVDCLSLSLSLSRILCSTDHG